MQASAPTMPRRMPPLARPAARAAAPRRATNPPGSGRPGAPEALARRLGLDAPPPWADYVPRGRSECAFAQVRLLGRVLTTIYDDALKPVGLRASQLALMWAIVAMEPVDMGSLGQATATDQTTLSRTVQNLRRERLVSVRAGVDRRVKVLRLTAAGRERFAAAMPLWERAQARAAELMPLDAVAALGRQVRRALRGGA